MTRCEYKLRWIKASSLACLLALSGCYDSSKRFADAVAPDLAPELDAAPDPVPDPDAPMDLAPDPDAILEIVEPSPELHADPVPDPAFDTLDAPDIVDAVPILHYTFEGNLLNSGTYPGRDGTWFGGSDYQSGRFGQAAKFDHSSRSHIILDNTVEPLSSYSQYTVGAWFKEDTLMEYVCLLDSRGYGGGFDSYHGISPERSLTTCYSTDAGSADCSGRAADYEGPDGVWHHILFRNDGTDFRIYIDNEIKWTRRPSGKIFSTSQKRDMQLGLCTAGDARYSNLYIDDLRVYAQVFDEAGQCEIVIEGTWDGVHCDISP